MRIFMAAGALFILSFNASAAGMTTHMFMTDEALLLVEDSGLSELLKSHRDTVLCGSIFPDIGGGLRYLPGQYDEGDEMYWSHAPEFLEAYLSHIKAGCGPPFEDCPELVAHFMGAAAHVMEDNIYDELFLMQVYSKDLDNDFEGDYDLDTTLDLALLVDHDRWGVIPKYMLPVDDMIQVFSETGLQYKPWQLRAGSRVHKAGLLGERLVALYVHRKQKKVTPWGTANIYSSPGGVAYTAEAVARYWEALWERLNDRDDGTKMVLGTFPPEGGTIPAEGYVTLYFTRGMKKDLINNSTFLVKDPDGKPVEGHIRFQGGESVYTYIASLIPGAPLAPGMRYTFEITKEAECISREAFPGFAGGFVVE